MQLVWPARDYLASYRAAHERGWSGDNVRGAAAAAEVMAALDRDADDHLRRLVDREAKGAPIKLPDGTTARRLPSFQRWLWDGEFCGVIGFRWQPGTEALPPHVLGHVGYAVVPWKRGNGYATQALRALLPEARVEGLRWIELTCDPDNVPSQKVILANGGTLVERFTKPAMYGGTPGLRYRITL